MQILLFQNNFYSPLISIILIKWFLFFFSLPSCTILTGTCEAGWHALETICAFVNTILVASVLGHFISQVISVLRNYI